MRRFPSSTEIELPCPHCGYDLRGLVRSDGFKGIAAGARCPECGEEADMWQMHDARERRKRLWTIEIVEPFLWMALLLLPYVIFWLLRWIMGSITVPEGAFWVMSVGVMVYAVFVLRLGALRLSPDLGEHHRALLIFGLTAGMLNLLLIRGLLG